MMKSFLVPSLLVAALASPVAAAPAPLAPTQKWMVEFADNQCVASRPYGTEAKPLTLVLKPSPMGKVLQLTFIREGFGSTEQIGTKLQIGADPVIETSALAFDAPRSKVHMMRINVAEEQLARLAVASSLSVKIKGRLDETLALSNMPALIKAVGECMADLQGHWNVGAADAKLRERARGNLAKWFSGDDYPYLAMRDDKAGTVQFVLLIDEAGKVADCTVTQTSNAAALDAQACAILASRAKMTPAIGLDGKPAKDAVTGRVTWALP